MNYPKGLLIRDTIAIESPAHLSEVLADASASDTPVIPVGAGTCLGTGNPVEHEFLALDLTGLTGIDDYIPTDMTASIRAGTSLIEVKATLAANGQELPIPLTDDSVGTIGGLVATGFAGAARLGKGTLKDVLIGCEYVRGDGLAAKAGGMTVKNVSGFEISRLMHGSWGSLAVLTRVNLKVLPIAKSVERLAWLDAEIAPALERQQHLLVLVPNATSVETIATERGFETLLQLEGRSVAVDRYRELVTGQLGSPHAWPTQLPAGATTVVAHGSVAQLVGIAAASSELGKVRVSLGTGTIRIEIDPTLIAMDDAIAGLPDSWWIEGGTPEWKHGRSVWGPARADRDVAQSIKNQFDPANVLNRGRLFV